MRQARRLVGGGILALITALATAGTAFAPPPACDLSQLQLRDSTVNQGLGSYDRLVRGKETLVRMYFSMPSCHDNNDQIQITAGSMDVSGAGTTLATGIAGTPSPVSTFPTAATYSTAPLMDAPADVKFVLLGSNLAPGATTESYTASFTATITFKTKTSASAPLSAPIQRTFTAFATKTVERRTNALRILVVPMGNTANAYSTEFPAAAVAAVENGMQTLSRMFPVPDGIGSLSGTSGGIRYAINSTLLNVTTPFCGGADFDTIKAELAQFLVSWNAANPTAQADRVVGAVWSGNSVGGPTCPEGMASLGTPEAWVRAFSDTADSPSMTGALLAMEIGHTFGLTPAARSFSTFHSLNTAADGTSPNRGYNVATRSFLADDRTALKLSGTWNNNTTLLEKEDYAYLLCVLGGQTNTECLTSNVAGTAGGVAAFPQAFAVTGTTDNTEAGTEVEESFKAGNLPELGTDPSSDYRLVQRGPGDAILQTDRIRVAFNESLHDDDSPQHSSGRGTFAAVVPLSEPATKFELWKGQPDTGIRLWSALKTAPPTIEDFTVTPPGFDVANYTNTGGESESQPSLTVDGEWVAWSSSGEIFAGPRDDSTQAVRVPKPALLGRSRADRIVFASDRDGPFEIYAMNDTGGDAVRLTTSGGTDPEWSPGGREIAFVRGGNIWIMKSDGSNQRQLTTTSNNAEPTFGPDGRIAFLSTRDGNPEVYVMNRNGSGQTRLTDTAALEQRPAWSPRGDLIAFASTRSGQWRLYTMTPSGAGQAQVPNSVDGDINPSFSPTGDRLAFYRAWKDATVDVDLFVIGVDGTNRVQVTFTSPLREFDPSWAGDDQQLVFFSSPTGAFDGQFEVETITVDGETRANLTSNEEIDDIEPHWQVLGRPATDPAWNQEAGGKAALAFVTDGDIYRVPVDISGMSPRFGLVELVFDHDARDADPARHPTWSQDETRIAFESVGATASDLRVLDVGSGETFGLVSGASTPSWSRTPGDDRIAFVVKGGPLGAEIWATDPFGEFDPTKLTDGSQPGWGTDGRISLTRSSRDGLSVWIYDVEANEAKQVVDDGSDSDLAGNTLAFVRNFPLGEFGQNDIMIGSPGGEGGFEIDVRVMDPDSEDLKLDVLVDCGSIVYVAAVAREANTVEGDISTWETNFDPSLTCANPEINVAVSDDYNRTVSTDGEPIQSEQKPPTAAIYTPSPGSVFDQYDLVPARGSGWDAEDGTIPADKLAWALSGPGFAANGVGPNVDFSAPENGFPLGAYELKLTVTDSAGNSDTATRSFTIVGDADNDGLTNEEEALACITFEPEFGSASQDPLNAFRDDDHDGIVNADDPAPCTAASEYEAFIDFDPAEMERGSQGVITARVRIENRDMKDVSMAYVKSINGIDVSANEDLRARQWNVARGTNVGQAKIDRTPLSAFFIEHGIANQSVRIVIAGSGGNGTWTFEGVGTLLVR